MVTLRQLLEDMIQRKASDLHLTAGVPPEFRIDGSITPSEYEVLTPETPPQLAYSRALGRAAQALRDDASELDFSFGVKGLSRSAPTCFLQRGVVVHGHPPDPLRDHALRGSWACPRSVREFTNRSKGLVLVTGPTGSGKSTTLAAMIDRINATRACHIMTIEDPIEYVHQHKKSHRQSARGRTPTPTRFPVALKYVLRQDPDVILIGEMRDLRDHRGGPDHRRDRPPGLRHAAHQLDLRGDQPHRGRVPVRPAAADPHPAGLRPGGRRHAAADPAGARRRAGSWRRGAGAARPAIGR